ncbi:MAG: type II toxin-antitoxin system RelE/ParE family toxin [Vicinamibacteraceae bacterium]
MSRSTASSAGLSRTATAACTASSRASSALRVESLPVLHKWQQFNTASDSHWSQDAWRSLDPVSQNWDNRRVRRVLAADEKPLHWVGSSKRDFLSFPDAVKDDMGNALGVAQFGGTAPTAKPWKGLGSGMLEIVESHEGNAYRAVYAVRFEKAVYVLHAFQKKSPSGIRTAKRDVDLVAERFNAAAKDYEEHYGKPKR